MAIARYSGADGILFYFSTLASIFLLTGATVDLMRVSSEALSSLTELCAITKSSILLLSHTYYCRVIYTLTESPILLASHLYYH